MDEKCLKEILQTVDREVLDLRAWCQSYLQHVDTKMDRINLLENNMVHFRSRLEQISAEYVEIRSLLDKHNEKS